MKKYIFNITMLCISIFSLNACHKEKVDGPVSPGQVDGMIITNHNKSIQADITNDTNKEFYTIDLDDNGQPDVKFISYEDSLLPQLCGQYTEEELEAINFQGSKYYVSSVFVESMNDQLEIAVIPNSNIWYESYISETSVTEEGQAIEVNHLSHSSCSPEDGNENWNSYNNYQFSVQNFTDDQNIILNELDFRTQTGNVSDFSISRSSHSHSYSYRNSDFDTEVYTHVQVDHCLSPAENEVFYIVFKNLENWGWISYQISEENNITIIESAISE